MEELRRTVAMLFRRKGKGTISEKEFILAASMDLRWFPPRDAQKLLQVALQMGLVKAEAGQLSPTFDAGSQEIPLDFHPTPEVLKAPTKREPFLEILQRLEEVTGKERMELVAQVNLVQEDLGVTAEVAALVVGASMGVDLSSYHAPVEEQLLTPRSARGPRGSGGGSPPTS